MSCEATPAYFKLLCEERFVWISSANLHGAHGIAILHAKSVKWIFQRIRAASTTSPSSYVRWADNPYPMSREAILVRKDDHEYDDDDWGLLRIEIDAYASWGSIILGRVEQERIQLDAFLALEDQILRSLKASTASESPPAKTTSNARAALERQARGSFLPTRGFCHCCGTNVVTDLTEGSCLTGCPHCLASWCR